MADTRSVIRNLGKSVAYSTLDVLRPAAPNIFSAADTIKTGFYDLQDFISKNKAKIPQQVSRDEIRSSARRLIDDTIRDIKRGNLSLGDLMDDDFDSMFDNYDFGDDNSEPSDTSEEKETTVPTSLISKDAQLTSESVITGAKAQLEGMQIMTDTLSKTQLKSAQYQTRILHETILSSTGAIMNTMNRMDSRLVSINNNIALLVKAQEGQSTTNQAMLRFFDQINRRMDDMEKRANARQQRQNSYRRDAGIDLMLGDGFDIEAYKKVVKKNFDSSVFGMAGAMLPMLGMLPEMMGAGGKFQPQKFALEALLRLAIPKSARRSIEQSDMFISNTVKNKLLELGKRKYEDSFTGLIGQIFGIDMKTSKSMRFDDFKRGEMSWNGEGQKVLTQIIPKQLAEIKAAILNSYSDKYIEPEYYDANSGRMMKKSDIMKVATQQRRQALESPFANLLNPYGSLDTRDQRTARMWQVATDQEKQQIEKLINDAISSGSGITQSMKQEIYTRYLGIIRRMQENGETVTKGDVDRIVEKINKAANIALVNDMETAKRFSSTTSAISQILMDSADPMTGKVDLDKIKRESIRVIQSNAGSGGIYTRTGQSTETMTEYEKQRAGYMDTQLTSMNSHLQNMVNSQNRVVSTFGKAMNALVNAWNGVGRSSIMADKIEEGTHKFYIKTTGLNDEYPDAEKLADALDTMATTIGGNTATVAEAAVTSPTNKRKKKGKRGRTPASSAAAPISPSEFNSIAGGNGPQSNHNINANQDYLKNSGQIEDAQDKTADATEKTYGLLEKTLGKDGSIAKFYNEKIKDTSVGKTIEKAKQSSKDFVSDLWNKPYYDEKTGKTYPSIKDHLLTGVGEATDALSTMILGDDADKVEDKKAAAKDKAKNILKDLNAAMRKHAPKILAGGIAGGALSLGANVLSGGNLGLIGNLFLPGSAIGGAILGMGLTIASQSDTFKNFMFGEKDDDGKRQGGLIKKEWMDSVKKAAPTMAKGAAVGGILGAAGSAAGLSMGFIPSLLLPGGALGGMLLGSAAGIALKSDRIQKVLFGEKDEDGKRTGSILSNAYNKVTQNIQKFTSGKGGTLAKRMLAGAGVGLLGSATIGQMGILGSMATAGGPIGAAVLGGAIGIASVGDKFNSLLFGTTEVDAEGNEKKRKNGLIDKFQTMVETQFLQPIGRGFMNTAEEFMAWSKMKIEVPFRQAFGPILDGFTALKDDVKDGVHTMLDKVTNGLTSAIKFAFSPITKIATKALSVTGKALGNVAKMGLYGAGAMVSAPLQMLSFLTGGKRRKEMKNFNNWANANKDQFLGDNASISDRFGWALSSLPGMFGLVMGEGRQSALEKYAEDEAWQYRYNSDGSLMLDENDNPIKISKDQRNNLGWMTAFLDRKKYKQNYKTIKARNADYDKLGKRAQKWAREDGFVSDRTYSDEEFADRTKWLARRGIEIKDQDELREFIFNNNAWRNKRENPSVLKEEVAVEKQRQDVSTIKDVIIEIKDNIIHGVKVAEETKESVTQIPSEIGDEVEDAARNKAAAEKKAATQSVITGLSSQMEEKETDSAIQTVAAETTGEKKGGILSILGDFAGKILGNPLALAAAAGAVLAIPGVSNLIKNVIGGVGDIAKKAFGVYTDAAGLTANNSDKRVSGVDENGNKQIVTNPDLTSKVVQAGTGIALTTATSVSKSVVTAAADVMAKQGIKDAATAVATAATQKSGFLKTIEGFANMFHAAAKKVLAKNAGSKLGKMLSCIDDFFSKVYVKITDKIVAKFAPKLAAATGAGTAASAVGMTPAAVLKWIYDGLVALKGAVQAERLFDVNKDDLDWKMRLISSIYELLTGTNAPGMIFTVVCEIVKACGLPDLPKTIATNIYIAFSDAADGEALRQAQADFEQEVKNYNEANGTSMSVDAYRDMKTKDQGWWSGVKNFFTGKKSTDYSQYEVTHSTVGSGAGSTRQGMGAVGYGMSQYDPRWANRVIGRLPNGQLSTMADGGCGPTALANASAALGRGVSPGMVGSFAAANGYISNGGANAALFDQGANAFGLTSSRIGSPDDIKRSLMNGQPVILSGKAAGYGTPYTGVGHIVTATGMDKSGRVIVQDPRYGAPQKYSVNELTRGMTNGWSMSPVGYGVLDGLGSAFNNVVNQISQSLFGTNYTTEGDVSDQAAAGGSSANLSASGGYKTYTATESTDRIWKYLKSLGYTDAAIAGIMGCWQIESHNSANVFEGYYLNGAKQRGFEKIFANNTNLNEFMNNVLIPAYKKSNISINTNAYKGSDGNYYPGLGLAQWTGPRAYSLFTWANSQGKDWRDLDTQLAYFAKEANDRGLKSKLNAATSAADGARLALDNYEMYPGWSNTKTGQKQLADRTAQANAIFGKYGTMIGRGGGRKPVGYGLFDTLTGAFSDVANQISQSIFGVDYTSSGGVSGDGSTMVGGTSYAPVPGANAKQSQLVNFLRSRQGTLGYSQVTEQDPDLQNTNPKYSSCAATVGWAYKNVIGGDFKTNKMSAGSYTQSQDPRFTTVYKSGITESGTGTGSIDESVLQPGDVLYYRRNSSPRKYKIGHTEMYIGDGKRIGHGGGSDGKTFGPTIKDLSRDASNIVMARRYNEFIDPSIGQGTGRPIGFGADFTTQTPRAFRGNVGFGGNYRINVDQSGVESRLDRLITLMESIDRKTPAGKAGPIGRGGDVTINAQQQPQVIVKEADRGSGSKASSGAMKNSGLRNKHMQFAAKK